MSNKMKIMYFWKLVEKRALYNLFPEQIFIKTYLFYLTYVLLKTEKMVKIQEAWEFLVGRIPHYFELIHFISLMAIITIQPGYNFENLEIRTLRVAEILKVIQQKFQNLFHYNFFRSANKDVLNESFVSQMYT